ncbi:MAG: hypothetical protein GKR89_10570 [Candidatus Latescibacteria bacterium]|nr:hypothetical protein [Candidatus Latescibacterota bacterium]
MSKHLPAQPHLRNLKNQAKRLVKAHRDKSGRVVARLRAQLELFAQAADDDILAADFTLFDAQLVIAREYGFAGWTALKRHVESLQKSGDVLATMVNAVEVGDAETVAGLLRANPDLATVQLERSPGEMACMTLLHRADPLVAGHGREMTEGHLRAAQLLIDHGADVNAVVDGYSPPLDVSAWSSNMQMVELLLANGADPNLGTEATPVDTAAWGNKKAMFLLMVQYGARYQIEHTIRLGLLKETRQLLDEDPDLSNEPISGGYMPLTLAAGRPAIFNLLLRRGADIHTRDPRGYTPLLAARAASNEKAVQVLLERGAAEDIFGAIAQRDVAKVETMLRADPSQAHPVGDGPAPIMWAAAAYCPAIVKLLLKEKAKVDIFRFESYGRTPLTRAILYHSDEIVRVLLEYGADPDTKEGWKWPGWPSDWNWQAHNDHPLYHALRAGTFKAAELLLDAGADVNYQANLLIWIGYHGELDRVKLMLERGADLQLSRHQAAFIEAAYRGDLALVELFATHGVDLAAAQTVEKKKARTALDWAQRRGPQELVALLEELAAIARLPAPEAARRMDDRSRFIAAVIDGDAQTLRSLLIAEPTLARRPVAQGPLFGFAARQGHQEVSDILVGHGAPWTIEAASSLGRVEQVGALLDARPALLHNALSLLVAAEANQVAVIDLLLDRGADIDGLHSYTADRQYACDGFTALHVAVCCKSVDALEVLLSRGANVHMRDLHEYKRTPLGVNYGLSPQREKIRDLLVSHGANPMHQPQGL